MTKKKDDGEKGRFKWTDDLQEMQLNQGERKIINKGKSKGGDVHV